jgi:DNA mismatch repair protein MutL
MPVRLLDEHVVNQIAAGEVVERPASVVKELVENALDAGARQIEVRLRQGGVALVEVMDDGAGMSRADAMLCIERHATSKIQAASDLVGVVTCGFRGEALPSIASVARLEIVTRRAEDDVGTRIRVEGGRLVDVSDVASRVGTTVSVRGLFADVPARRKFLRAREVEAEHAVEAVRRALLLRCEVGVRVEHDGREVLRADASSLAVRASKLLGVDGSAWRDVAVEDGEVSLTGVVGAPYVHRAGAAGAVYVYAHGRYLREGPARRAVTEAYRGALPAGRAPVVVLEVRVASGAVDVNVHPQKTEVRFANPGRVVHVVGEGVRGALREAPTEAPRSGVHPGRRAASEAPSLFPMPGVPALPPTFGLSGGPPVAGAPIGASRETVPQPTVGNAAAEDAAPPPSPVPLVQSPPPSWGAAAPSAVQDPGPTASVAGLRRNALVGVLRGRFAVLDVDEGLMLVDVDRIRRRDLAEVLRAEALRGAVRTRALLLPTAVTLTREATRAAVANAEAWLAFGVEIAAHDPHAVAVHALPDRVPGEPAAIVLALVGGGDLAEALAEVASLASIDEVSARGWLARAEEEPGWLTDAVAQWSAVEVAARLGQRR